MKQKNILLIFFLGISISYGQTLSPLTDSLVSKIANQKTLSTNWSGILLKLTDQREAYFTLSEIATDEDLILLTKHESPNVRCYAFEALTFRKNIELMPLLINHLYDTAIIYNRIGCMTVVKKTGDYFIEMVTSEYTDKEAYKLTVNEKLILDSILLFDKNINLESKSALLLKLQPDLNYYYRIREIVLFEKMDNGIVPLSKYKNCQDIQLIIEKLQSPIREILYNGLWAVRNFPDSIFFYYLKEIYSKIIQNSYNEPLMRMYYQALVQYKNIESKEILELSLKENEGILLKLNSRYIWLAIKKYYDPIYNEILDKIKLSKSEQDNLQHWFDPNR